MYAWMEDGKPDPKPTPLAQGLDDAIAEASAEHGARPRTRYFVTNGSYSAAHARCLVLPVVVAIPLALGGWALASEGVVPTCKAGDRNSPQLVFRGGYALACGPGSAVVKFKGTTYRMQGSKCFIAATALASTSALRDSSAHWLRRGTPCTSWSSRTATGR